MARYKIEIKPYHGRLTLSDILKIFAVILFVVTLLAGGALLYANQGGTLPSLSLPWSSTQEDPTPEVEPEPEPLVTPEPEVEPEPEPESEPLPESEPFLLSAIELSLEDALSPSLLDNLSASGGNAILLDMKSDDGTLGFYTENPTISAFPAVLDQSQEDTDALKALLEGDIYAVARLSMFKDNIVGNDADYAILSNSGYRWTDYDKVHWSSPSIEDNRAYLIQCIIETAELGFDEILLDNFGYPDRGEMGWIRSWAYYDLDTLDVVITDFLAEVAQELEQYPNLTLSVRVPSQVLDGTDVRIGLTVEALNQYADTLWIDAQDAELYALAGITLENRPVLVDDALSTEDGSPSAILSLITF